MDGTCFHTSVYGNCLKAFFTECCDEGEGTEEIGSPIDNSMDLLEHDNPNSWEEDEGQVEEGPGTQEEFMEELGGEEDQEEEEEENIQDLIPQG